MRPADLDEAAFEVNVENKALTIRLNLFLWKECHNHLPGMVVNTLI